MFQVHGTSLPSTPGQFRPALLPVVSKNDDEECYFLKKFGFRKMTLKVQILQTLRRLFIILKGLTLT